MAYTEAQRDALQAAIASGVLAVTINGRTVTYHSLKEMRALLAEMEAGLSADSGTHYPYRFAAHSKGV